MERTIWSLADPSLHLFQDMGHDLRFNGQDDGLGVLEGGEVVVGGGDVVTYRRGWSVGVRWVR